MAGGPLPARAARETNIMKFLSAAAGALFLIAGPGSMVAQIKVGGHMPPIRVERFFNTGIRELTDLKGLVVLYEFLDPAVEGCRQTVPHVNRLVQTFGRKGFAAVVLTKADPQIIEQWIYDLRPRAVLALERDLKSYDLFGLASFPAAVVAGPGGEVLWIGHPKDYARSELEVHLRKVKSRFPVGSPLKVDLKLPKEHAAVTKFAAEGRLGAAHAALVLAETAAAADEIAAATLAVERRKIEDLLEFETGVAERAAETRKRDEAWKHYERIARHFEGMPAAEDARVEALAQKAKAGQPPE